MTESRYRTIAGIIISGGIGGLAAVACLAYLSPIPLAPKPAPLARMMVQGGLYKLQVERDSDLSFKIPVRINGKAIQMLVDTGANVTVLTYADATTTGLINRIPTGHVDVRGINKEISRLRRVGGQSVHLGPIFIKDVPISIDESGELTMSILGQDAFCNLRRITIENNQLELMHDSTQALGCPIT